MKDRVFTWQGNKSRIHSVEITDPWSLIREDARPCIKPPLESHEWAQDSVNTCHCWLADMLQGHTTIVLGTLWSRIKSYTLKICVLVGFCLVGLVCGCLLIIFFSSFSFSILENVLKILKWISYYISMVIENEQNQTYLKKKHAY